MSETVTPNDLAKATDLEVPTEQAPEGDLTATERAEYERLKEVHRDEQRWRREATSNHPDAEAFRNLLKALGGVDEKGKPVRDFDAKAAFEELKSEVSTERQSRVREFVARTEGVDPEDFVGDTEEQMRKSAQKFKAKVQAKAEAIAEAAQKTVKPAAAPAKEVTANGKVSDGDKQLKSTEGLTRAQIIDAHKSGRFDDLTHGKAT